MAKHNLHSEVKLLRAALISPLTVPLFLGIGLATLALINQSNINYAFFVFIMAQIIGLPFTYSITLILVLPLALILRRQNALYRMIIISFCALIAPPLLHIYRSVLTGIAEPFFQPFWLILPMACGFVSGMVFCKIARILTRTRAKQKSTN